MSSRADLIELALEDARLYQFQQQRLTLPARIKDLDASRKKVERLIEEAQALFEKSEREARKIDLELQEYRQRRAKSESRQSSVTSTDQYQALLKEIEQQERRIDELESALLEALERSEQAGKRRDQEHQRLQEELGRLQVLQDQLRSDLQAANDNIETQRARRDQAMGKIDSATRLLYQRVLRAKGDAAIALVTEKVCGICNGVQPPQIIQMLRQSEGLQTCQMCGRILVWNAEEA